MFGFYLMFHCGVSSVGQNNHTKKERIFERNNRFNSISKTRTTRPCMPPIFWNQEETKLYVTVKKISDEYAKFKRL